MSSCNIYNQSSKDSHLTNTRLSSQSSYFEGNCWPGNSVYPDFMSPAVRSWWASNFQKDKYPYISPIMHHWNDMNEPTVFSGREGTLPKDSVHLNGQEHSEVHNLFGGSFVMGSVEAAHIRQPADRPFILTRSFFAGTHRYSAVWTGDNQAKWEHLQSVIPMLLSLNSAQFSFCGADIGGFFFHPSAELMVRWYQLALFTPFFRSHAHIESPYREPWEFKQQYRELMIESIQLRYKILPLIYRGMFDATSKAIPPMQPIWMQFDEDFSEEGIVFDDEYDQDDSSECIIEYSNQKQSNVDKSDQIYPEQQSSTSQIPFQITNDGNNKIDNQHDGDKVGEISELIQFSLTGASAHIPHIFNIKNELENSIQTNDKTSIQTNDKTSQQTTSEILSIEEKKQRLYQMFILCGDILVEPVVEKEIDEMNVFFPKIDYTPMPNDLKQINYKKLNVNSNIEDENNKEIQQEKQNDMQDRFKSLKQSNSNRNAHPAIWYDLYTGIKVASSENEQTYSSSSSQQQEYKPCGWRRTKVQLTQTPAYQRGGSIIPIWNRTVRSTHNMPEDPLTLIIAPDSRNIATGTIFLDDGRTHAWEIIELTDIYESNPHIFDPPNYPQTKPDFPKDSISFRQISADNKIWHSTWEQILECSNIEKILLRGQKHAPLNIQFKLDEPIEIRTGSKSMNIINLKWEYNKLTQTTAIIMPLEARTGSDWTVSLTLMI
ncbi:MAG: Alpha-glucosidase [Streblomastix strix]|uniref:Alpha-glucosidase n=1 Tax=Streblomastix strix TaxID=222440 RepID=A0A5J4UW59_9EUKA|nr:MAG: Alpha-glucosidase [Streblomastix strix]